MSALYSVKHIPDPLACQYETALQWSIFAYRVTKREGISKFKRNILKAPSDFLFRSEIELHLSAASHQGGGLEDRTSVGVLHVGESSE